MTAQATRTVLQLLAAECRSDALEGRAPDREHARWLLRKLPASTRATIGTRLDSSSLFQLNRWGIL